MAFETQLRAFPPRSSIVDGRDCLYDSHTADSRTGCAAARVQAARAGMEGTREGRSRDQHGDGRETSSLEAAEG